MSCKTIKDKVSETIIANLLDGGLQNWKKSWETMGGLPRNPITKKFYRGSNIMTLSLSQYDNPYFCTLKQGNSVGARVRKGEKGQTVLKGVEMERKEMDAGDVAVGELSNRKYFVMVPATVFNVSQFDNFPVELIPAFSKQNKQAVAPEVLNYMMEMMGDKAPKIRYGKNNPCYFPMSDTIEIPDPKSFESIYEFMAAYIHELGHSTGHESRLHRPNIYTSRFGTPEYAGEEIVVEIASAMICAELGLDQSKDHLNNHSAYIKHWLKAMNDDYAYVFKAIAESSKVFDYVMAYTQGFEPTVKAQAEPVHKSAMRM